MVQQGQVGCVQPHFLVRAGLAVAQVLQKALAIDAGQNAVHFFKGGGVGLGAGHAAVQRDGLDALLALQQSLQRGPHPHVGKILHKGQADVLGKQLGGIGHTEGKLLCNVLQVDVPPEVPVDEPDGPAGAFVQRRLQRDGLHRPVRSAGAQVRQLHHQCVQLEQAVLRLGEQPQQPPQGLAHPAQQGGVLRFGADQGGEQALHVAHQGFGHPLEVDVHREDHTGRAVLRAGGLADHVDLAGGDEGQLVAVQHAGKALGDHLILPLQHVGKLQAGLLAEHLPVKAVDAQTQGVAELLAGKIVVGVHVLHGGSPPFFACGLAAGR